mgnify:CR=1 FL=1|tara:strand:- start:323 stop:502 length:180 start_codon:yes stop_codon:yes gene_type:complete
MLEKTITDNSSLGLKSASVKLTLPAIELICLQAQESDLNNDIKKRLIEVIGQIIDKQLA